MVSLLLSNVPNIVIQTSYQRNSNSNPEAPYIQTSGSKMEASNDDIPSLRGWFLKEKRDKFKRRQNILPGTGSNRRWFTIERINSGGSGSGDWALCYYKRSSSDKEQRCGWLFLNDVVSLSQDVPNRWITIEHPTRVLRVQSPSPAQHRVWFSTLSKCCKNVRKEIVSPSSSVPMVRPRMHVCSLNV